MKLTIEQRARLKLERDTCANEACDRCGLVLGHMRFTRFGQPGEWCSRECRDGRAQVHDYGACRGCGVSLAGGRKGRLYCGNACRMRKVNGRDLANNTQTPIQNKPLAAAFSVSGYTPTKKPVSTPRGLDGGHE